MGCKGLLQDHNQNVPSCASVNTSTLQSKLEFYKHISLKNYYTYSFRSANSWHSNKCKIQTEECGNTVRCQNWVYYPITVFLPLITILHIVVTSSSVSIHQARISLQQRLQYEWQSAGAHCTDANGATRVQAHSFFTLKLCSLAAVPPEKNPLVLVKQEDGRAQYPAWTIWKLQKLTATARNQEVNPPPNYRHQNFKIRMTKSWDSSGGTVIGLWATWSAVQFLAISEMSGPLWGPPSLHLFNGSRAFFPMGTRWGIKLSV